MPGETRRAAYLQPGRPRALDVEQRSPPGADVIVRFQLLTLALAEGRGIDPDRIHRDDERWERARAVYD